MTALDAGRIAGVVTAAVERRVRLRHRPARRCSRLRWATASRRRPVRRNWRNERGSSWPRRSSWPSVSGWS